MLSSSLRIHPCSVSSFVSLCCHFCTCLNYVKHSLTRARTHAHACHQARMHRLEDGSNRVSPLREAELQHMYRSPNDNARGACSPGLGNSMQVGPRLGDSMQVGPRHAWALSYMGFELQALTHTVLTYSRINSLTMNMYVV